MAGAKNRTRMHTVFPLQSSFLNIFPCPFCIFHFTLYLQSVPMHSLPVRTIAVDSMQMVNPIYTRMHSKLCSGPMHSNANYFFRPCILSNLELFTLASSLLACS